jgi:hypothetical protein
MFRFTIRDVLWLMVVVGLAIMWQADHRRALRFEESHLQLTERLAKAETQIADYEAKLQDELAWEASRRDPGSLLYFPPLSPKPPPDSMDSFGSPLPGPSPAGVDPFGGPQQLLPPAPTPPPVDPFDPP